MTPHVAAAASAYARGSEVPFGEDGDDMATADASSDEEQFAEDTTPFKHFEKETAGSWTRILARDEGRNNASISTSETNTYDMDTNEKARRMKQMKKTTRTMRARMTNTMRMKRMKNTRLRMRDERRGRRRKTKTKGMKTTRMTRETRRMRMMGKMNV